jgi:hypothetical protein
MTEINRKMYDLLVGSSSSDIFTHFGHDELYGMKKGEELDIFVEKDLRNRRPFLFVNTDEFVGNYLDVTLLMKGVVQISLLLHNKYEIDTTRVTNWAKLETDNLIHLINNYEEESEPKKKRCCL